MLAVERGGVTVASRAECGTEIQGEVTPWREDAQISIEQRGWGAGAGAGVGGGPYSDSADCSIWTNETQENQGDVDIIRFALTADIKMKAVNAMNIGAFAECPEGCRGWSRCI